MSRSNNTELSNPATRFFEWSGSEGAVQYWDKDAEQSVNVPLPFRFLILDKVAQVAGGIDRDGTYYGFWSNAVRNTKTQMLTVRSKAGVEASGYYDQIKGTPGVKFMTGLYVAYYDDDRQLQIGYLKVKGAALTEWIEFTKTHKDIYKGAFAITGKDTRKKGTNTYYAPVFQFIANVSDEAEAMAKELDVQLQQYLNAYFEHQGAQQEQANAAAATEYSASREDFAPAQSVKEMVMAHTPDDYDLDSIPF